jgi:hypothetical protein
MLLATVIGGRPAFIGGLFFARRFFMEGKADAVVADGIPSSGI